MDYKKYPKSLRIGFVGDQNARTPTVDISELLPELPGATATLLFRRPGEETAYPAAAQLDENGILTWTVSGGDARYPGTGCAQVLLSKGTGADEQRLLGPVIMVTVLNSIAGLASEDAPEGYESWIAEIEAAGEEAAQDAEAWAKGTRGGTAVESTDPAYHANAAYHAGQAGDSASDAEAYAKGTRGGTAVESTDPAYHANAAYHAGQAGDSASDAEAWAVGKRGGADVGSSDPAYHNNAKYYAEQAAASAEEAGRNYAPAIRTKASGAVAHFTDGAVAPMALDIVINPNQSGSGDPSPTNVRTIDGWTGITVKRTGKNLFVADANQTYPQTKNGVTATKNSDGSFTFTGTPNGGTGGTSDSVFTIGFGADQHLKAGSYILSGCPAGGSTTTYRMQIAATGSWSGDSGNGVTFEAPAGAWNQQGIRISIKPGTTIPEGGLTFKPMIRRASDLDNTYEPYNGSEYEITLPNGAGTVYGGTLHINQDGTGTLTVNKAYALLNDPDKWETVTGQTVQFRYNYEFSDRKIFDDSYSGMICSYLTVTSSTQYESARWVSSSSYKLGFRSSTLDLGTVKTDASAGKIAIVYDLATPVPYTFTAPQISSLFGENNVWADTGDVSVEYTADTKTYIEHLTQPDQDWIADAGISIGKFFMVGNELYIATSGIAAGETIVPGTNCTKMSLAQALNNINA